MKNECLKISTYGERVYKLSLEVIKYELDKLGVDDINSVQAVTLMNIGGNTVSIGEIISRGYYSGSNASYNVRKLESGGYITQGISPKDKRVSAIKLSEKGLKLYEDLGVAMEKYSDKFMEKLKRKSEFENGMKFLKNVEDYWKEIIFRQI